MKSKKIFGVALDVFEGEKAFMFKDMTKVGYEHYPDLQELTSMDNVIISSHIAFYTDESVRQITEKTLSNFEGFVGKKEIDEKAFVAWNTNKSKSIKKYSLKNCIILSMV